jgi:hypothetical protein
MTDIETVRACCAEAEGAAALDRLLARLEAAEKVCELIKVSLSPKLRQAASRKPQWWDVGIAVKQWEELRGAGAEGPSPAV